MDVRVLVVLMTVTLIILFILTDKYRKRELEFNRAEVAYYEAIQQLRQSPQDLELKAKVEEQGKKYGMKSGMLDSEIEQMLERDMTAALSIKS